jgi:hypothetical protein
MRFDQIQLQMLLQATTDKEWDWKELSSHPSISIEVVKEHIGDDTVHVCWQNLQKRRSHFFGYRTDEEEEEEEDTVHWYP